MAAFEGLGKALRWLRNRQDRKQYQVAEAAGVTKAMLSAYETGKQKPSLETLEKILDGLGANLGDLHHALRIVSGQQEADFAGSGLGAQIGFEPDIHRALGSQGMVPVEVEESLQQMLFGFHSYLRHMSRLEAELRHRLVGAGPGKSEGAASSAEGQTGS